MLIVEFRLDSPILQKALSLAPETTVTYEELYSADNTRFLFWVEGKDLATFEESLAVDPTVTNPVLLTETETHRLYRVTFTDFGETAATSAFWRDLDISTLDVTGSIEGWDMRVRMPDRDVLRQYRDICEKRDLQFQLHSIYEDTRAVNKADVELTNRQKETLIVARDLGYFKIPRQASLSDLADHCGISSQAASERIRRGTLALIDTAFPPERT